LSNDEKANASVSKGLSSRISREVAAARPAGTKRAGRADCTTFILSNPSFAGLTSSDSAIGFCGDLTDVFVIEFGF